MEGERDLMYVGLNFHKRVCYGTMTDRDDRVVKQGRFGNDLDGLEEFMDGVVEALVAMEAEYCWQPLYDGLEEAGYDVRLTHPQKVKAIARAPRRRGLRKSSLRGGINYMIWAWMPRSLTPSTVPGSRR